jgi:hypothetical protein
LRHYELDFEWAFEAHEVFPSNDFEMSGYDRQET